MKKILRGLSLTIVTAMLAATMAACGERVDNTVSSGSSTSTDSGTSASSSETATHNLKVLCPESTNTFIKFADREEYPVFQDLVKLFTENGLNVEFEVIPQDQYGVVAQTRLATASELPDFMNIQRDYLDEVTTLNLAGNGTLLPVNKILEEHGDGTTLEYLKENAPFVFGLTTAADGNMYWIPNFATSTYNGKPGSTCQTVLIRKDWLEKLNLSTPETADEFYEVMKAFRDQDANGNGAKDEIIALDGSKFMCGIPQWFGLGTDLTSVIIETGEVVSPWYQEGAKAYFEYMNKLVKEELLDPTLTGAATHDLENQRLAENKVSAVYSYTLQAWLEPQINAEGASFLPIKPLTAVEGIDPIRAIEPPQLAWRGYAVTKGCTDLEGMAKLLDLMYSEEARYLSLFGNSEKTSKVVDGVRVMDEDYVNNTNWELMANERTTVGGYLWNNSAFPVFRSSTMENQIKNAEKHKADFQVTVFDHHPTAPDNNEAYLAVPTTDELDKKAEIQNDLLTYSKELATQLILGHKSLDDWDTYMAELKELGLDDMIAIDQARSDRYQGK